MDYITPMQLRAYGTGLDLTRFGDADLAGAIDQAEGQIDAYMAFREESSLGFVTGPRTERAPWNRKTRRIYPQCLPVPVQTITSFSVVVGQNSVGGVPAPVLANVDPSLIVINNDLGYLEVVSLAVIAFGLTPVVVNLTLIQPYALFTYQAGYSVQKVATRLVASADGATFHSFRPNWDIVAQVPIVTAGGVVAPAGSYAVNPDDGVIVFGQPPAGAVKATFTHTIPDIVTDAARLCTLEVLGESYANRVMAGFDMIKSPALEARRRGTFRDIVKPPWQTMLDTIKYSQVSLSGGAG